MVFNKKVLLILSIIIIFVFIPKPYSITTEYSTNPEQKYLSMAYVQWSSGFCFGIVYPMKPKIFVKDSWVATSFWGTEIRYTTTWTTTGWDCKGYKFLNKERIAI